jgi:hypothetical protein
MGKYACAVLVLAAAVGWAVWRWTPATFTVWNESGQPVLGLAVEVGGRTFRFGTVPPGGEVRGSFHIDQEDVVTVRGRLADGTPVEESCGYVVWEETPRTSLSWCGPVGRPRSSSRPSTPAR